MKKALIFFGVIITAFALFYLATSFVETSFDIAKWTEKARVFCVAPPIIYGIMIGTLIVISGIDANN